MCVSKSEYEPIFPKGKLNIITTSVKQEEPSTYPRDYIVHSS
jgi:hypothetical protein